MPPCPTGTVRARDGSCERRVVVPIPIPVPDPSGLVARPSPTPPPPPRGPELAGACQDRPGQGSETGVVSIGNRQIRIVRNAFEINYGGRRRNVFTIRDLPRSVGARTIEGQELLADAYVDLPPLASMCRGRTDDGHQLAIVDVPMLNGGTAPACVLYCPGGNTTPEPPQTLVPPQGGPTTGRPPAETLIASPHVPRHVSRTPPVETIVARSANLQVSRTPPVETLIAQPTGARRNAPVETPTARPTMVPQR